MRPDLLTIATTSSAGLGALVLLYWTWQQRTARRRRLAATAPSATGWQRLGTLESIALYPLKGSAALTLAEVDCNEQGLNWRGFQDRRLILLTEDGRFAHSGTYLRLHQIRAEIVAEGVIVFHAPNQEAFTLQLPAADAPITQQKQMRGFRVPLVECGPAECHRWFSQAALQRDTGMRLHVARDHIMDSPPASGGWRWWRRKPSLDDPPLPVMAVHQKSIADLNKRLAASDQAKALQFRGNLLINSEAAVPAYDEDNWRWLRIAAPAEEDDDDDAVADEEAAIILRFNSDCLRCIAINVNTDNGRRNANYEPLRTLQKYRLRKPREPAMGVYFDVLQPGRLRRGAVVYVQRQSK